MIGRLEALHRLAGMEDMLIGEIRYGKATLPECCMQVAEQLPQPYRGSLRAVYERMTENMGETFDMVFREEMEKALIKLPLKGEDRELVLALFSQKGFEENAMQIRTIEQGRERLRQVIENVEAEHVQKCRMAVGLGIMGGLLVTVVLV